MHGDKVLALTLVTLLTFCSFLSLFFNLFIRSVLRNHSTIFDCIIVVAPGTNIVDSQQVMQYRLSFYDFSIYTLDF